MFSLNQLKNGVDASLKLQCDATACSNKKKKPCNKHAFLLPLVKRSWMMTLNTADNLHPDLSTNQFFTMNNTKCCKRNILNYVLLPLFLFFMILNVYNYWPQEPTIYTNNLDLITNNIPSNWTHTFIEGLKCAPFIDGTATAKDTARLNQQWSYSNAFFFDHLKLAKNECESIRMLFDFNVRPLSDEERDYPLAYGMVVYQNLAQLYFTMSAIYHPQNAYCIAVDGKSSKNFKDGVHKLAKCFPNITIIPQKRIKWCDRSVLEALFDCFQELTYSNHPWKYYQYFSGFDLPLKTNLEMVRIFKQLNHSVIAEVTFGGYLKLGSRINNETRLPVQKASMGALVSREAARDALCSAANHKAVDEVVQHIYQQSLSTYQCCSDELLWSTVFGNKKVLPLIGSFDAQTMLTAKILPAYLATLSSSQNAFTASNSFPLQHYNIARCQTWYGSKTACNGEFRSGSCVYGLGDIHRLIRRAELAAHKFHMDVQPAAFFCLWKHVKDRALDSNQRYFEAQNYCQLPHVQLNNGRSVKSLLKEYKAG